MWKIKPWASWRLRSKLFFPLVGLVFSIFLLVHVLWMPGQLDIVRSDVLRNQEQSIHALRAGLLSSLVSGDVAELHATLSETVSEMPTWVHVSVLDAKGRHIYPLVPQPEPLASANTRLVQTPLSFQGTHYGSFRVWVDAGKLVHAARQRMLVFEVQILAAILLVFWFVGWLQRRWLLQPLERLQQAASQMAGGDYSQELQVRSNDEVGELTRSFEFMRVKRLAAEQATSQAQAAQAQAQEEIKSLLRALDMHAIVSVADRRGRITDVNPMFCTISGYSREELLGQDHHIVNSGVHDRDFWLKMWRTIGAGFPWRGEICNRSKNGDLYWVDSMISPFVGVDGKIEKYISIRTDVTHHKKSQQEIEQMADRLALAAEGARDGLWDWMDVNKDAQWWSPAFYELIGTSPKDLPASATHFEQLWPTDEQEREQVRSLWSQASLQNGVFAFEHTLRTRHQGMRWFAFRGKVFPGAQGGGARMAGSVQDIHERKLAQIALAESERFSKQAQKAAGVGVFGFNLATGAWSSSQVLDQILGIDENYPRNRMGWVNLVHPDYALQVAAAAQATREDGVPFDVVFKVIRLVDGSERWLHAQGEAEWVVKEQSHMLVGTLQDITARKHTEMEVALALELAQQASQAKSQFLANVSHELRTPMNAILGMLQMLDHTAHSDEQRDYTRTTITAAKSLLELLNGILDFSKIEAGKLTLNPQPFAVEDLVREVVGLLQASLGDKALDVQWRVEGDVPHSLVGDAMRLRQILINLLGNAVKFTAAGYVRLTVSVIEHGTDAARLRFAVRDTGIGIAADKIHTIFESFSQAEADTTRRFGGTGLGLSISQQLVGLMGGCIEVQSTLGVGSLFSFDLDLPIAEMPAPLAITSQPGGANRLAGLRILVVEDNLINQKVAKGLLTLEGAVVTLADNGRLGVDAIARTPTAFDVVLMDLQMPEMDGLTAARYIRQELGLMSLPVIAMTANVSETDRNACLSAGMQAHVGKPFDRDYLVSVLLAHTGRSAAAQAEEPAPPVESPRKVVASSERMDAERGEISGVDMAGALARMGGDMDIYLEVLDSFLGELTSICSDVDLLLRTEPEPDLLRVLHTFKGLAATVGATHLSGVAAELEGWCKAGLKPSQYAALLQTLRSAVEAATPQVVLMAREMNRRISELAEPPQSGGLTQSQRDPSQER